MHAEANHPPNGQKATGICLKMGKRSNAVYRSQEKPRKGGGDSGGKGKHGCPQAPSDVIISCNLIILQVWPKHNGVQLLLLHSSQETTL